MTEEVERAGPAGPVRSLARRSSTWKSGVAFEWAFVAVLLICLAKIGLDYFEIGYLPPPFFPDPNDNWADGYNSSWWAFNGRHMYDVWRTVYPPLSFVLLRGLGDPSCYEGDAGFARDCDWRLWWSLLAFCFLNAFLAFRAFRLTERRTALPRVIAFMLSLPMLYAFEHSNTLILAYTGLIVAFGPTFRSAWARWLGLAVAINLKVYFVPLALAPLLQKRWRWTEGALLVTAIVWLFSYFMLGSGSLLEVVDNIVRFQDAPDRESNWWTVVFASSYTTMVKFVDNTVVPVVPWLGTGRVEFWSVALTMIVRLAQAATLAAFVAVWLHPKAVTRVRVAALAYAFILISIEPGGYTMAGVIFLVFLEPWRGGGRITAIICAYLLCLSIDFELKYFGGRWWSSYLAKRVVWQELSLTIGPLVRPGLIIAMQIALVSATFADIRRYLSRQSAARSDEPRPLRLESARTPL